jgi:hypothetical protein
METSNSNLSSRLNSLFDPESYRGHHWADQYNVAGLNLIDEINQLDPDLVIDAGCAHNRFKGHIQNLIGFDRAYFPFADLYVAIEDAPFRPESADAVLALGSMHFGTRELVERQVDRVVSWVKPGGFIVMRVNNKIHFNDKYADIRYHWTDDDRKYFAEKHNLIMHRGPFLESKFDERTLSDAQPRLMAEKAVWWWQKPGDRKKYKIDPVTCQTIER